jgi:lysophospholipase L1-like esterase
MAIVTRLGKGSKLTIEEMDNNLLSLETGVSANVSAITSKLDKGTYTGTAKDLENTFVAAVTGASGISIVPTSAAPAGTGIASFTATQAGTYTNYGGVVVAANSFAIISRSATGVFSISQTAFDLVSYQKVSDTQIIPSLSVADSTAFGSIFKEFKIVGNTEIGFEYRIVTLRNDTVAQISVQKNNGTGTFICDIYRGARQYGVETFYGGEFSSSGYKIIFIVDWDKLNANVIDFKNKDLNKAIVFKNGIEVQNKINLDLAIAKNTTQDTAIALNTAKVSYSVTASASVGATEKILYPVIKNAYSDTTFAIVRAVVKGVKVEGATTKKLYFQNFKLSNGGILQLEIYDEDAVWLASAYQTGYTFPTGLVTYNCVIRGYLTKVTLTLDFSTNPVLDIAVVKGAEINLNYFDKLYVDAEISKVNTLITDVKTVQTTLQDDSYKNFGESVLLERGKNLLDSATLSFGQLNTSGVLVAGGTNWLTSDFIAVPPLTQISVSFVNVICQYDSNKVFIIGTRSDSTPQAQKTFTTHANCRYMRLHDYYTTFGNKQVEIGATSTTFIAYTNVLTASKSVSQKPIVFASTPTVPYSLKGEKLLAIGDSVTAALNYQAKIATGLEMTVTTHALGGIGIRGMVDGQSTLAALTSSQLTGVEVITFFGGLNNRGTLQGTITDLYPAQNTICGDLNYALNKILDLLVVANNTECRVICILPYNVGKYNYIDADGLADYPVGSGQSLYTITRLMKQVCERKGIPTIDLFAESGFNSTTWAIYTDNALATNQYVYKGVFASVAALPAGVLNDGATVTGQYNGYIHDGTNWIVGPTPFPWNTDQLHPSTLGHARIANLCVAKIKSTIS